MNATQRLKKNAENWPEELIDLIKKLFLGFHVLLWIGLIVYLILLLLMKAM